MPRWYGVEVVLGNLVIWYLVLGTALLSCLDAYSVIARAVPCHAMLVLWCDYKLQYSTCTTTPEGPFLASPS
jgi:hypothetical protein